jgi:hypothetical protein
MIGKDVNAEGKNHAMEKIEEEITMSMFAEHLGLMAEFAANPELVAEKMEELERGIETATAWLDDPTEVPEGVQEIEVSARALSMLIATRILPLGENTSQLCNALNCISSEAISRAYLKGRGDAMAEMVLCGAVEETDDTQ